jgi:hypothetical protein
MVALVNQAMNLFMTVSWDRSGDAIKAVHATMNQAHIRGLVTAFHRFVVGLPRSKTAGHPLQVLP